MSATKHVGVHQWIALNLVADRDPEPIEVEDLARLMRPDVTLPRRRDMVANMVERGWLAHVCRWWNHPVVGTCKVRVSEKGWGAQADVRARSWAASAD